MATRHLGHIRNPVKASKTMRVSDAILSRITTRAFKPTPIPLATVRSILEVAKRTPSGGNLQPWHVWVLAGHDLAKLKALVAGKLAQGHIGDGPTEYHIYPPELKEPYKTRRFRVGEDMYATMGIPREDKAGRMAQFARNFDFFGAPVGMFFAIDRSMQQGQWSDLGMFILSIMLLAREHGLATAAQEAWALWHKTVGEFAGIPEHQMLFCGLALGYADEDSAVNSLRSERAPLHEFSVFRGFQD